MNKNKKIGYITVYDLIKILKKIKHKKSKIVVVNDEYGMNLEPVLHVFDEQDVEIGKNVYSCIQIRGRMDYD